MPTLLTRHAQIRGISTVLPKKSISVFDISKGSYNTEEIEKISRTIGVKTLYQAENNQTAADLCFSAAEKVIEELLWERDTIDGLLFLSQTPDYIAPATACVLHNRLNLSKNCIALDINYGCSAFINGLFLAAQFIESRVCKRILVLVGDTLRRTTSPLDKGLTFILSDAGSATAMEYSEVECLMTSTIYTDGSGFRDLIIPAGGFRIPKDEDTCELKEAEEGNMRSQENFYMNGMNIFTFAIKRVPEVLCEILVEHGWIQEDVQYFLLHQANAYMVNYIAKRAKIDKEKIPININKYGNTSGATIPLLISDLFGQTRNQQSNVVFSGFGVGLSWGAVATTLKDVTCPPIMFL